MQDPATYFNQFPEQEILKCPRCDSSNTKFCYYNNYNLSQPRHYCKNCKRYWTKGGTLRNIPVGGATRKITKRSKRPATSIDAPAPINSDNQQHQTSSSYLSHSLYPRMGAGGFEQIGVGDDLPKAEKSEERFAGLGSGEEMNCWSGSGSGHDWPDLAIFTPGGSGFQ